MKLKKKLKIGIECSRTTNQILASTKRAFLRTNNKKPVTDGKVVFCKRLVHVVNENLPTKRFYPYLNIVF